MLRTQFKQKFFQWFIYILVNVYKSLFLEYLVQNHVDYVYKTGQCCAVMHIVNILFFYKIGAVFCVRHGC
jgi:hypothetical protein